MEDFKIELFKKDYGFDFPQFTHLTDSESLTLRILLFEKYGFTNISELVEDICLKQNLLREINALNNFKLVETLEHIKILSLDKIFINWYRYDDIDMMSLIDLDTYFYDIWYSGPNDIDIFDGNLNWIVSIRHDGCVSYIKK